MENEKVRTFITGKNVDLLPGNNLENINLYAKWDNDQETRHYARNVFPTTPEEYKNSRVGWGHSSYVDAVNIALKGNVKQLVLFHHDPAHTDDFIDEIVSKARNILKEKKSKIICYGAKEGMVIKL